MIVLRDLFFLGIFLIIANCSINYIKQDLTSIIQFNQNLKSCKMYQPSF